MKKILLIAVAFAFGFSVQAQKSLPAIKPSIDASSKKMRVSADDPINPSFGKFTNHKSRSSNPGFSSSKDINIITLGASANGYGFYNGSRTSIWAEPNLNSIAFVHRGGGAGNPVTQSGRLCYDYSNDGGLTWTNNLGPIYSEATATGFYNARYPQAVIYNPSGNTNPANAKYTFHAAATDGTNWRNNLYGTGAYNSGTGYTRSKFATLPNSTTQNIPDAMHITTQGVVWVVDNANANGTDYNDSITVRKGTYSSLAGAIDYVQSFLEVPTLPAELFSDNAKPFNAVTKIAFAPDGQTGYILMLSLVDSTGLIDSETGQIAYPFAGYFPVLIKTTNGGTTWGDPIQINLHDIPNLRENFPSQQFLQYDLWVDPAGISPELVDTLRDFGGLTAAFDADLAVDANGNPHMAFIMTWREPWEDFFSTPLEPFSVHSGSGMMAATHVWSPDGGTTFAGNVLAEPMNFRGEFAGDPDFTEDNVPTICTSWDATKMFISWLDTDTLLYPGVENGNPDIHIASFDVTTNKLQPEVNVTTGTDADGTANMAKTSYFVFDDGAGNYEIPIVYQELGATSTSPVTFKYIQGHIVAATAMTECGDSRLKFDVTDASPADNDGMVSVTPLFASGSYSYAWSVPGNVATISGLSHGMYYVTVTNTTYGCVGTDSVYVDFTNSVKIQESVKNLSVRPNPTTNNVSINFDVENNSNLIVSICNLDGKVIYTDNPSEFVGSYNRTVDMSNFAKGVYMLKIISDNKVITKKIVKY